MAWIGAPAIRGTLTSAQTQALEADKPLMVPTNLAEHYQNSAEWRTGGSWATGSDDTATGYATARVFERFPSVQTKGTTAGTVHYLIFDLDTSTTSSVLGDAARFDTVAIINHNFGSLTPGAGHHAKVEVEVSNNSNFSSAYTIAERDEIQDDRRLIFWSLGAPEGNSYEHYTDIRYLRLKITMSISTAAPSIGQVILGRRYQMSQRPNVPYDDQAFTSEVSDFSSTSGIVARYVRHAGRRKFAPTWNPTGADGFGLDDLTTLRDWFENCGYGSKPFLYLDKPHSERETALTGTTRIGHYCMASPALNIPAEGPVLRVAAFEFTESAPFVSGES